jgi:O-antigen/teichoic acid export membrane protein
VNFLLRRSLALGGIEALMRMPLVLATGFLARHLGSVDYGQWMIVLAFQAIVLGVASLGLSSALSRDAASVAPKSALGMLIFALSICLAMLLALAIFILGFRYSLAALLGLPSNAAALIGCGLLIVLAQTAESLLDAYFKARELITRQALFQFMRTAVDVVVILVVFSQTSPDAREEHVSAVMAYVALAAIAKVILYPFLLLGTRHGAQMPDAATKRSMLQIGLPVIPAAILLALFYQEDRLILGHILEPQALGVYALAAALAAYLHSVGTVAYAMLLPRLSRFYDQGSQGDLAKLMDVSQQLFVDLMGPVLVCLALLGSEIVVLLAGPSYTAAGPVLLALGVGVAIDRLFGPYGLIFYLVRRSYWVTATNGLSCVTVAIGVVIGAQLADALGAACGAVVAITFNNIVRACLCQRFMRIVPSPMLWRSIVLTGVTVGLAAAFADYLDMRWRLLLTLLAILYAARAVVRLRHDDKLLHSAA